MIDHSLGTETILRMDPAEIMPSSSPTESEYHTNPEVHVPRTVPIETVFRTDPTHNVSRDPTESILRMDPADVRKHFDRIRRFRILVVGRSNAGKTTLLQRVCNTTELPEIFNLKGKKVCHVILQEFPFLTHGNFQIDPQAAVVQGSLKASSLPSWPMFLTHPLYLEGIS